MTRTIKNGEVYFNIVMKQLFRVIEDRGPWVRVQSIGQQDRIKHGTIDSNLFWHHYRETTRLTKLYYEVY
jgi:hypothetical protein